jgi:S1-C subfamily serine protease
MLVALGGCAGHRPAHTAPEAGPPADRPTLPPVVQIETATTVGSGFFVTPHLIVTNAHVLAGARSAFVSPGGFAGLAAPVVHADERLDFAILYCPLKGKPLPIRTAPVTHGEDVMAVGFPQGRAVVASSTGTVRGFVEPVIIHDALIAAGSSGGPLVDGSGRVIGINTLLAKVRGDWANETDRVLAVTMRAVLISLPAR